MHLTSLTWVRTLTPIVGDISPSFLVTRLHMHYGGACLNA